ncbi:hypothetical protein R3W88_021317 [Solanum pinnatisectum]|uniref:Uncharacterized protein n=1 Tax=Solanum pinnatisectum TaxID=50273 RepID=A0AAV9LUZ6_9SOLN|nr:hypothetical protein R3W88_021317 [Solanum pinnatisectum]
MDPSCRTVRFEVRTQKPTTSRIKLVMEAILRIENKRMYLPPSPAITAHPPLFMLKSCLCLSRLSFACYSLRLRKNLHLDSFQVSSSSLEFSYMKFEREL